MMKKITLIAVLFAAFSMNAQIFEDDFELEVAGDTSFSKWDNPDVDGDTEVFEVTDFTGSDIEASPLEGIVADSDSWEDQNSNSPMTPDNYLITKDAIDLTGVSDGTLSFTFGTPQNNGTFLEDRLAVYISTSNDPAVISTESPVFDQQIGDLTPADNGGANSAVDVEIDLSSYAGETIYIAYRHFDTFDHNSVLIDNVVLDGTLGLEDINNVAFNHYYLSDSNELKLTATVNMNNVQLFNIIGQEVVNRDLTSNEETLNLSNLTDGVYIARVNVAGTVETFKIIKK